MGQTDSQKIKTTREIALVYGGAHFIGSHLCEALLTQGLEVLAVDDFSIISTTNITHLQKDPHFHLIKLPNDYLGENFSIQKVDYIFHTAGLDFESPDKDTILNSLLINSEGNKWLLEKAIQDKASLLFFSLADIYSGVASQ